MKRIQEGGFSLLEIIIAMGLVGIIGAGAVFFLRSSEQQTMVATESIQEKILAMGAEKFIQGDLAQSAASFNFLNVEDDSGRWFFAYERAFECEEEACERVLTLELEEGETRSKNELYLLVVNGGLQEKHILNIGPEKAFDSSGNYQGINHQAATLPHFDISKSNLPSSPWQPGRMMVLSSKVAALDCAHGVLKPSSSCNFSCDSGPDCNAPVRRHFKMLGVVSDNGLELDPVNLSPPSSALLSRYLVCTLNRQGQCGHTNEVQVRSAKAFFENLPYIPGRDNGTYVQPVELVRYFLYRESPTLPLKNAILVRERATFQGGSFRFSERANILVGLQSAVFKRKKVSDPTITFKLNRLTH